VGGRPPGEAAQASGSKNLGQLRTHNRKVETFDALSSEQLTFTGRYVWAGFLRTIAPFHPVACEIHPIQERE
jgi:hypothetical protein